MESVSVVSPSEKMPLAWPSGDRVALAIAALLVGGVIMLSTLSLGLHEANLIARITLLSSGGAAAGAGAVTALVMSIKSKKSEAQQFYPGEIPQGDSAVFAEDYERNGAHSYRIKRGSGQWVSSADLQEFDQAMREISLSAAEIVQVKQLANQVLMMRVTEAIYEKTGKLARDIDGDKNQLVYLISKGENGPVIEAHYHFELIAVGVPVEGSEKEYIIGRHWVEPQMSRGYVSVSTPTNKLQKFNLEGEL